MRKETVKLKVISNPVKAQKKTKSLIQLQVPGPEKELSNGTIPLMVMGQENEPVLTGGDVVYISPRKIDGIIQVGEYYVIKYSGFTLIRRLNPNKDKKHWTLTSDNPEKYQDFEIEISKVTALFIVVGVIKRFIM